MSKKRKIMIGIAVVVVGILIGSILGWSMWKGTEESNSPTSSLPPIPIAVAIDSEDNIHIAIPSPISTYIKINDTGTILVANDLYEYGGSGSSYLHPVSIAVDKENNPHMVSNNEYLKFDHNGSILIKKTILNETFCHPTLRLDHHGNPNILIQGSNISTLYQQTTYYIKLDNDTGNIITKLELGTSQSVGGWLEVDSNNDVHIVYSNETSIGSVSLYYLKLDENGTKITEKTTNMPYSHSVINTNDIIYAFSTGAWSPMEYSKIRDGEIIDSGKIYGRLYTSAAINHKGNVYVVNGMYWQEHTPNGGTYSKICSNGTVMGPWELPTERYAIIPEIVVDSNDNIYIIYFDCKNYAVYMIKLDENGTVLIPEKKVWEHHENTTEYTGPQEAIPEHKGTLQMFLNTNLWICGGFFSSAIDYKHKKRKMIIGGMKV